MNQDQEKLPILDKMLLGKLEDWYGNMKLGEKKECLLSHNKGLLPCAFVKAPLGIEIPCGNGTHVTHMDDIGDVVADGSEFHPHSVHNYCKGTYRARTHIFKNPLTLYKCLLFERWEIG